MELRASLGTGEVTFRPAATGVEIRVRNVCVSGMTDGLHGFHVHERGDMTKGCASMGPHYDPHHADRHGGPMDPHRHMGDLGNLPSRDGCLEDVSFVATGLTLGELQGRGLVLHEREDDLGRGNTHASRTTGSAGARISCGTIRGR